MSLKPIELPSQARVMRTTAELQDRAYAFGARQTPHWSFYDHGTVTAMIHGEQPPTMREADAWRLAFDVPMAMQASEYASPYSPTAHVRSERYEAMFQGVSFALAFTYPCSAPVEEPAL